MITGVRSLAFILLLFYAYPWSSDAANFTPALSEPAQLSYRINRAAVPDLYYNELTLVVDVGAATVLNVSGDGQPVAYFYDPATGQVTLTTAAEMVQISLENGVNLVGIGAVIKAPLKYNKKWAWSHGLDDNVYLEPAIQLFSEKGWTATLFMIGHEIEDDRQESWIIDAPDIRQLVAQGWSFGSHTWDHECNPPSIHDPNFMNTTILDGYNRLKTIIQGSAVPGYKLLAFAAPCFIPEYHPYIAAIVANGQTDIRFNESGNNYRLIVDPGASDYSQGGKTAVHFDYSQPLGRHGAIDSDGTGAAQVRQEMDWMADNAAPGRHFWYNTLSHGHGEAALGEVIDYAYHTYGPDGHNELWVAPSDEIYSYLLVRDNSQVTRENIHQLFLPMISTVP